MKKIFMAVFLANFLFAGVGYKVTNFDISGIKLGMTQNEVLEVIKKRYKARDTSSFKWGEKQIEPYYSIQEYKRSKFDKGTKVHVTLKQATIKIVLGISNPSQKEYYVEDIVYSSVQNKTNEKKFYNAAMEKYGKPSSIDHSLHDKYIWCEKPYPSSKKTYSGYKCSEKANKNNEFSMLEVFNQPYLELNRTFLKLYNPIPYHERELKEKEAKNLKQKPTF
ncbi:hypothetical protein [Halarcobacter anaerophilus]|uniref:Uncharacterized protein n=1 Tax=Halarcobacter anaerophilus TaxID=877500 RepID=A0A4Q0Y3X9_9BACT|nr:hypothetical protein [Halarcobacter anaerophilus]QDF28659.1 hypothetical protein AANAER_1173 [Halarcobacter anaerophilus]RXJ63379.1 hypothetical protein CRV06_06805 [Halarcobacter anaerophilus]